MKVLLVGYGEMMRSLALGILHSKHELVGIFRKDRIKKNLFELFIRDIINPSADYMFIKSHSINEIVANSVNSEEFRQAVKDLKADVVLVGSWGERFSVQTLNTIPNGFINVHSSLLPEYRGPNPYLQVILNNEEKTGITFHLMDVNYDTGSILHQKEVPVLKNDTGGSLKLRCCEAAKNETAFLLDNLKERIINQRSQIEEYATYQGQIDIKDAVINFEKETSEQIKRRIMAFSPWIQCFIMIKGEFYTFSKYQITKEKLNKQAGTIVDKTKNSLFIVCKDNVVMKFSDISIKRPFSKLVTKLFWDKIININDMARG